MYLDKEEEKEKSIRFKFCCREYKIIHKNKKNIKNTNLNYLGIFLFMIKKMWYDLENWFFSKVVPFCDKYEITPFVLFYGGINLLLIGPFAGVFLLVGVLSGYLNGIKSISVCQKNYTNCDIYKQFCYRYVDNNNYLMDHHEIYNYRKDEIMQCIESNARISDFIYKETNQIINSLYYWFYYSIPIVIILWISYIIGNYVYDKSIMIYKKTKDTINNEIPIVEEV